MSRTSSSHCCRGVGRDGARPAVGADVRQALAERLVGTVEEMLACIDSANDFFKSDNMRSNMIKHRFSPPAWQNKHITTPTKQMNNHTRQEDPIAPVRLFKISCACQSHSPLHKCISRSDHQAKPSPLANSAMLPALS